MKKLIKAIKIIAATFVGAVALIVVLVLSTPDSPEVWVLPEALLA